MSVYTLRAFITISGVEMNTVNRVFSTQEAAENVRAELITAAATLCISDLIRFTIIQTSVEA